MTTVDERTEILKVAERTGPGRWVVWVLLGAVALVVAAAMVAGYFGVAWIKAGSDGTVARAQTRDEVDRVARSAITTFNTLDYRKVDEGLNNWLNASAGDLHNEVVGRKDSSKKAFESAKTVSTANILSLAVTDLSEVEGKASVIAAIEVTVAPEGKQPEKKYQRIQGELLRTPDGWKLSGIAYVDFAR
jgi:Mce-associated membrane protein